MASPRHQVLAKRIEKLREHLLPEAFEPTGNYENLERVGIRALSFRVLAHAEIEAYLEDRVIEVAKLAWERWQNSELVTRSAMCLIAFSGKEMKRPPSTLAAPGLNKTKTWPTLIDIKHRLGDAVTQYVKEISQENHGIREHNLLAMLLPLGMDCQKIDEVIIANLDDFGRQRGIVAHSSSETHVKQGVDPKDEYEKVLKLLSGIEPIDSELDKLIT